MAIETIYTEENCRLVGEWLGINDGEFGYLYWPNGAARDIEDLIKEFKVHWEIPQIIREALARDGIIVLQAHDVFRRGTKEIHEWRIYLDSEKEEDNLDVPWDIKQDPSARHALWDAVVKLLKGREK